ncbi:hypothetical protein [Vibrio phage JSF12]|uniref:Uncharacterized protein n=2 Tax=Jesfedecavirus TaxID=2560156 RepID=A0A2D0Z1B3_9CAUD|nr:hypothetical protein FDI98_gp129 [Vibrio phage JSF10]YP_009794709.1 hypothetical protein HOS35_gp026 [Vibrio phage JSF12]ASV43403.1 hypothetical protein [Vibrio phage JSF10]ASV43544.1 hypothetical protein [Vibrio phage JSF12]
MPISRSTQSAKTQIDTLVHVFAAGDGGPSLVKFRTNYLHLEKMADAGDDSAK